MSRMAYTLQDFQRLVESQRASLSRQAGGGGRLSRSLPQPGRTDR